jgi:hypothetical protein
MILLREVPNVAEGREGWELYIVTGGVMVGIYPVPSFSASHDIGQLSQQDHV